MPLNSLDRGCNPPPWCLMLFLWLLLSSYWCAFWLEVVNDWPCGGTCVCVLQRLCRACPWQYSLKVCAWRALLCVWAVACECHLCKHHHFLFMPPGTTLSPSQPLHFPLLVLLCDSVTLSFLSSLVLRSKVALQIGIPNSSDLHLGQEFFWIFNLRLVGGLATLLGYQGSPTLDQGSHFGSWSWSLYLGTSKILLQT